MKVIKILAAIWQYVHILINIALTYIVIILYKANNNKTTNITVCKYITLKIKFTMLTIHWVLRLGYFLNVKPLYNFQISYTELIAVTIRLFLYLLGKSLGMITCFFYISNTTWNHDLPLSNSWECGPQKVLNVHDWRFYCLL